MYVMKRMDKVCGEQKGIQEKTPLFSFKLEVTVDHQSVSTDSFQLKNTNNTVSEQRCYCGNCWMESLLLPLYIKSVKKRRRSWTRHQWPFYL